MHNRLSKLVNKGFFIFFLFLLILPLTFSADIIEFGGEKVESFDKLTDNIQFSYKLVDGKIEKPIDITTEYKKKLFTDSYKFDYYVTADDNFKSLNNPQIQITETRQENIEMFDKYSYGYYVIEIRPKFYIYKNGELFTTKNEERLIQIRTDWEKEAKTSNIDIKINGNKAIVTLEEKNKTIIDDLKINGGVWHKDPIVETIVVSDWEGTFNDTIKTGSGNLEKINISSLILPFTNNSNYDQDAFVRDHSVNGNNGETSAPNLCATNDCFDFDGDTENYGDYLSPDPNQVTMPENFSVLIWLNPDTNETGIGSPWTTRTQYPYSTTHGFQMLRNSVLYQFRYDNGASTNVLQLNNQVDVGNWQHLVLTVENISGQTNLTAYYNGAFDKDVQYAFNSRRSTATYFQIGRFATWTFDGQIGSVQVFNKTLRADEVLAYNSTDKDYVNTTDNDLFLGYALNSTYYNHTVYDLSNTGYNQSLGAVYDENGFYGGGINFDGVTDQMIVQADSSFSLANTSFTIAGWFKTTGAENPDSQERIYWSRSNGADIYFDATGYLAAYLDIGAIGLQTSTDYYDGLWHFVTLINNQTENRSYLYVDGISKASPGAKATYITSDSSDTYFGNTPTFNAPFNGTIDEFSVIKRALSYNELICMYNNTNCPDYWEQNASLIYEPTGNWTSITYDSGVNATTWTNITIQGEFNNESVYAYIRTSNDTLSWTDWIKQTIVDTVTGIVNLVGGVGRYLEVKLEIIGGTNKTASFQNMTLTYEMTEPNVSIITPTDSQKLNGLFNVSWTNLATSGRTDVWLRNSTDQFNLSYNQTDTNTSLNYDFTTIGSSGLFNLTVQTCENLTNVSVCGNDTVEIELVSPTCQFNSFTNQVEYGAEQSVTWNYVNYTTLQNYYLNITHNSDSYLYNQTSISPAVATMNHATGIVDLICYVNSSFGEFINTTTFNVTSDAPTISITNPTNTTYTTTSITLESTASDTTLDSCWYSIDNGATNTTFTCNSDVNPTVSQGANTWYVWANDSVNEIGTDNVSFFVDSVYPTVTIDYPVATTYNNVVTQLNFSAQDTNLDSCWYSTNNGITNVTIVCGTNATGLSSIEGANTWYAYANDTLNQISSDSVTFTQDTIVNIILPSANVINDSAAEIIWGTDQNANTTVYYSNDSLFNSYNILNGSGFVTDHSITITGLTNNTIYYYKAHSCNPYNYCTNSSILNFITMASDSQSSNYQNTGFWGLVIVLFIALVVGTFLWVFTALAEQHALLKLFFMIIALFILLIGSGIVKDVFEETANVSLSTEDSIGTKLDVLYKTIITVIIVALFWFIILFLKTVFEMFIRTGGKT